MQQEEEKTKLADIYAKWGVVVEGLTTRMSDINGITSLQIDLYNERQNLVEEQHSLLVILSRYNKAYKKEYGTLYKKYKEEGNLLYKSEAQLEKVISSELVELAYTKEMAETLVSFYKETLKTIDNLIYGVRNRIELHKIINGII